MRPRKVRPPTPSAPPVCERTKQGLSPLLALCYNTHVPKKEEARSWGGGASSFLTLFPRSPCVESRRRESSRAFQRVPLSGDRPLSNVLLISSKRPTPPPPLACCTTPSRSNTHHPFTPRPGCRARYLRAMSAPALSVRLARSDGPRSPGGKAPRPAMSASSR